MPKRKLDPLPSAAFQILLSLAGEDLHGYGILPTTATLAGPANRFGKLPAARAPLSPARAYGRPSRARFGRYTFFLCSRRPTAPFRSTPLRGSTVSGYVRLDLGRDRPRRKS